MHPGNSMRSESVHWSSLFVTLLAQIAPCRAFIANRGIKFIYDLINDYGYVLSFRDAIVHHD